MKKHHLIVIAAAAAALATGLARAEDAKVAIAISGWTGFAPLTLAKEAGIFKKHGLDVTIKKIPQKDRHLAIASGDVQCAATTVETWIGWNAAGVATYDPLTGVTDDGVSADGSLNLNSGAESTIHGLLSMEALDANPDVAVIAHASAHIVSRDGQITVEAESATLSGAATTVQANPVYTGEAQWSGGAYIQLGTGGGLSWTVASGDQPRLVQAIVNRVVGPAGTSTFTTGGTDLGSVRYGNGGAQGNSATPGALLPVTLPTVLAAAATQVSATTEGDGQLDAIQLTPLVSTLVVDGSGHSEAVLTSVAGQTRSRTVSLPGTGWITVASYDRQGRLVRASHSRSAISVDVPAGGFAIVRR